MFLLISKWGGKFTIFPEGKMALAPSGRVLWGVPPTAPIGSIGRKDGSIIILAIGYDRLKPQFPLLDHG